MYRVIKRFTDLADNGHAYFPGDEYPREGVIPTRERIVELSSDNNRRGEPVIAEYKEFVPVTGEDVPKLKKRGRKNAK